MKSVARRLGDKQRRPLIKQGLEAPVEEDDPGNRKRSTHNRGPRRGTPQGAPTSPLLSNRYLRRFLVGWKPRGGVQRGVAPIVNDADDFVICCKRQAEQAMEEMRWRREKLKREVSEEKTHRCRSLQEEFNFLGYTFGRGYSPKTGRAILGTRPSKKSLKRRGGVPRRADRPTSYLAGRR